MALAQVALAQDAAVTVRVAVRVVVVRMEALRNRSVSSQGGSPGCAEEAVEYWRIRGSHS